MPRALRHSLLTFALLTLVPASAEAVLSSSERGQIRDFFASARAENAGKVRSLVARTDLSADESVAALTEAVTPVPFSDARGTFLKELVFGGSSAPSRPILTVATVRALLARADTIYQRYVGGLDHEAAAIGELVAIYGYLDSTIANAGKPTSTQHDASAGVPAATYDECAKVLREHIERNARWLKGASSIPASTVRLRAQAQVALIDMLPDGLTRRVDAADRLGLSGARRTMLTDFGVLLADSGKVDDAKAERVRQLLVRLPGARVDLSLLYAGEDGGTNLRARGNVLSVAPAPERFPFADAAPGSYDPITSAVAHDLAISAARRALDNRAELKAIATRDALASSGDSERLLGRPRAPSVENVIGAAIHALLIDGSQAVDLAVARVNGGRPESAAILSDALGALAVFPFEEPKVSPGTKVDVGKNGAWTTASSLRFAPNGAAVAFSLDGHAWTIDRASSTYSVISARRDGATALTGQLATSKGAPRDGAQWADGAFTFARLRGAPRVAVTSAADKASVKLIGGGTDGYDVVTTLAPAADVIIEGDLLVRDGPAGVAFRVQPTTKGFRGVTLVVTPGGTTVLATAADDGERNLGAPQPSPTGTVHVKVTTQGKKVEAIVGSTTLQGTLPDGFSGGDVALIAKRNASIDVSGFSVRRR